MLAALVAGQTEPDTLADLAQGSLRKKHDQLLKALTGRVNAHHRFILAELLCQIDSLDETIARFSEHIQQSCPVDLAEASTLLDTIPGVARLGAQTIAAEIGNDMSCFASAIGQGSSLDPKYTA